MANLDQPIVIDSHAPCQPKCLSEWGEDFEVPCELPQGQSIPVQLLIYSTGVG